MWQQQKKQFQQMMTSRSREIEKLIIEYENYKQKVLMFLFLFSILTLISFVWLYFELKILFIIFFVFSIPNLIFALSRLSITLVALGELKKRK